MHTWADIYKFVFCHEYFTWSLTRNLNSDFTLWVKISVQTDSTYHPEDCASVETCHASFTINGKGGKGELPGTCCWESHVARYILCACICMFDYIVPNSSLQSLEYYAISLHACVQPAMHASAPYNTTAQVYRSYINAILHRLQKLRITRDKDFSWRVRSWINSIHLTHCLCMSPQLCVCTLHVFLCLCSLVSSEYYTCTILQPFWTSTSTVTRVV